MFRRINTLSPKSDKPTKHLNKSADFRHYMASKKTIPPNGALTEGLASLLDFPGDGAVSLSDPAVRQAIYGAYRGVDFYTGQPLSPSEMRLDHVFPRSQGGADSIYNLVPTCTRVNGEKSAKVDLSTIGGVLYLVRTLYVPAVIERLQNGDLPKRQRTARAKSSVSAYSKSYDFLLPDSTNQSFIISTDTFELLAILDAADKEDKGLFCLRERKGDLREKTLSTFASDAATRVSDIVGDHYSCQYSADKIFISLHSNPADALPYLCQISRQLSPSEVTQKVGTDQWSCDEDGERLIIKDPSKPSGYRYSEIGLQGETLFRYRYNVQPPPRV